MAPPPGAGRSAGGGAPRTELRGARLDLDTLIRLRRQAPGLDLGGVARARAPAGGGHLSSYRGRGMEFEEARPYQPGDDIRTLDWRVTARTGRPHTKLFREERERPVLLVVDLGPNMAFGTRVAFKSAVAAGAAALLAWAAAGRGDRVGAMVYTGEQHRELRAVSRTRGVLALLRVLASMQPDAPPEGDPSIPPLSEVLARLGRVVRPGSLVFLVSDFHALDAAAEPLLARIARASELWAIRVHDTIEGDAPPPGRYAVWAGHGTAVLDTTRPGVAEAWSERFAARRARLESLCARHGIRCLSLATDAPVAAELHAALLAGPGSRHQRRHPA